VGAVLLLIGAVLVALALFAWNFGGRIAHAVTHPAKERGRLSFFEAYPVGPENIVMLGDSITAGGEWEAILPGARVLNRGIRGDQTDDLLRRLGDVTQGRPRKLFVLIGTNDIGNGVAQDRTVANLSSLLDRVAHDSPGTAIYLQSVLPRDARYRTKIEALNARIAQLAAERALPFLDLYPSFVSPDGGIREELTYDGIHLSGTGYRKWQELVQQHVRS